MLTFEESKVFEYSSSVFKRLEKQDGGYYPSRHDPIALSETASHFNISEAEASRIFSEFSKDFLSVFHCFQLFDEIFSWNSRNTNYN